MAPYEFDDRLIDLENMPFLSLPKVAGARAMYRLTFLYVDGTMLPKKQNSPTVSSSSLSRTIRLSDEVVNLHLDKLIFKPHFQVA